MSEKSWATLLEVDNRIEAEIMKQALEAQGIPAEIFQEGAMRYAYPMAFGPLAKVEICVPKDRIDEAKAVWADLAKINPDYSLEARRAFLPTEEFEILVEGLEKAGIGVGPRKQSSASV